MNFVRKNIFYFIVVKSRDEVINKIKEECNLLYKEKIKMMNLYESIYCPNSQKKQLILIPNEETSKYFSSCYLGLKDFLKYLRNYPDIIYKILKSADKKYFTYHFNYFILNNFFEDILCQNEISKDLINIIEHLLKKIISKLENPLDFINKYQESNLCSLLNSLICKIDIQIFFNSILSNIIKDYITSGKSSKNLFFEVGELVNFVKNRENNYKHLLRNSDISKKKEIEKKQKEQSNALTNIFRMRFHSYENTNIDSSIYDLEEEALLSQNLEENEEFETDYLQELDKNDLKKLIQNNKDKNLKEYLQYQISLMNKNDSFYSNSVFLEKIQKSQDSEKILFYYERNFMIVVNIINQILEQIQNNICIFPTILKMILKILVDLLKNKFTHIKNIELNVNIGVILMNLINQFFSNHEYNSLISSVLFSSKTKKNLSIIASIFSQFISLKFYNSEEKSDYTPFNLYFSDKYNILFNIYEKLLDFDTSEIISQRKKSIKLFNFNNKNINTDSNKNNSKEKNFNSIAICYNVEDITTLLNIIKHNLNYILKEKSSYPVDEFLIIYNKLKNNKEVFKTLKEKDNNTINYYYLFDIIFSNEINKKYNPIFQIEKKENKNNSKKTDKKNEIISAQNLLSELLMNIPELENIEINNIYSNNTKQILSNLSSYLKNRPNIMYNYDFYEGSQKLEIPLEWYITSLSKSLEKIDDKYKKKEYEYFFIKLKNNITNSIEEYGFEQIGKLSDSIKYIGKYREKFIEITKIFEEINLNNKILEFINDELVEVEIQFKYNENEKFLKIDKKRSFYDSTNSLISDNIKICYNISEFINNFPDLIFTKRYYNISLFELERKIRIEECLNTYFNILEENISNKFPEETKEDALLKIKNYIFEKLYIKTFPKFPEEEDSKFFLKVNSLSWTKPENFSLNNFNFELIIPMINDFFKQIDIQRSPLEKLSIIRKIFEIIFNTLKYIKGENFSSNDISNICQFIIIKGKPEKLISNLNYLEIFENNDIIDNSKIYLKELKDDIENILKINYKSIKGISELEFKNKCKIEESKNI